MNYVKYLVLGAIKLSKEDEKLVWSKNPGSGDVTTKLSYEACMEEDHQGEKQW